MDRDRVPGGTMGVEEEFLLVDPSCGATVPAVEAVVSRVAATELPVGGMVQRELRASQIEAATGICTTASQLREQLNRGRRVLARAAGVLVVPVGTPPVAWNPAGPVFDVGEGRPVSEVRYSRIDQLYAGLTWDYEACGLHVHVGVPDKDSAVAVVNHVNRWLPILLALSVNSPLHAGRAAPSIPGVVAAARNRCAVVDIGHSPDGRVIRHDHRWPCRW